MSVIYMSQSYETKNSLIDSIGLFIEFGGGGGLSMEFKMIPIS